MLIGAHMSIGKGLSKAIEDALSIKSTTMQIFSRNPRGGKGKKIDPDDVAKSQDLISKTAFGPWIAHAPYTINLSSAKPEIIEFGINTILEDFDRMQQLGAGFLIVHGGSHGGQGQIKGEQLMVEALSLLLSRCPENMFLLLEIMAGQGTELVNSLEQASKIVRRLDDNPSLGICLDTCHLFAAGYDVRNWDKFWGQLDSTLDAQRVKVLHLNDSKFPLGSKKDRHAAISKGEIGEDGMKNILLHPSMQNMPIILETPHDLRGWEEEIKLIRKWWKEAGIL
ncbi:MAG: deoxyribonuclease IV [Bacillota bacterium]